MTTYNACSACRAARQYANFADREAASASAAARRAEEFAECHPGTTEPQAAELRHIAKRLALRARAAAARAGRADLAARGTEGV